MAFIVISANYILFSSRFSSDSQESRRSACPQRGYPTIDEELSEFGRRRLPDSLTFTPFYALRR
jgi:hypothetical protein